MPHWLRTTQKSPRKSAMSDTPTTMSFAKKLTIAFTLMLAATVALGIASMTGIRGLGNEFDNAALLTR